MTELDKRLATLIKAGDSIETAYGRYIAEAGISIRTGTAYYHAIVPVFGHCCILPFYTTQINAVYRNGVCLYQRGETAVQKGLWE